MAPRYKKMTVQCLNSDRISSLPQDIIGHILTCMPIRDAIRTSILSRNWRSSWKSMTRLTFDDQMVKVPSHYKQLKKFELVTAILNVLLMHTGSILEIIIELDMVSEFDPILCYLSRHNHLQKFCLGSLKHCYKLPSSFFSLQEVEFVGLQNCLFRPPIEFDGFSKLGVASFGNVDITSKTLQVFLSNCPLLRELILIGDARGFDEGSKFTFVELLQCVPLIKVLVIRDAYMECFSAGGMPHKLPTSLVHLQHLSLDVYLNVQDEVSSALCLMRSSPNLVEIIFEMHNTPGSSKNDPDLLDHSGFTLDHLMFFEMRNFTNEAFKNEFLKLIMAKSPMLMRARIVISERATVNEEVKIRRYLKDQKIPRASPSAKLIIARPTSSYDSFCL